MNPAGDAAVGPVTEVGLAERILQDGEVIILAVKPSGWFVLLNSLPTLAVLGTAAVVVAWIDKSLALFPVTSQAVLLCCSAAAVGQLVIACFRWLGRLYVLTNRRVLRLRGVVRADVCDCPLSRINEVTVVHAPAERLLGLGSVGFAVDGNPYADIGWTNLARPDDVAAEVRKAIQKAKGTPNGS